MKLVVQPLGIQVVDRDIIWRGTDRLRPIIGLEHGLRRKYVSVRSTVVSMAVLCES